MSRITRIELCDYRAFPGPAVTEINLRDDKRHLLLYGENGSGKSSLGRAFKDFFDARANRPFNEFRNVFTDPAFNLGRVILHFDDAAIPPLLWTMSSGRDGTHPLFAVLCATSAWLDYAEVRRIYDLDRIAMIRDIFPLCRQILLRDVPMPARIERFGREWDVLETDMKKPRGRGRTAANKLTRLNERVDRYNKSLNAFLPEWEIDANSLLDTLAKQTRLHLSVSQPAGIARNNHGSFLIPPRIGLRLYYRGYEPPNPLTFLNESRLTACAISLWLAALLRSRPLLLGAGQTYPRVLVLDDVLLSLDMDHRRPLLTILGEHFADWQVFLLTHTRTWYEIAKQRLPEKAWQFTDLYAVRAGEYESPVVVEDEEHLYRALRYLEPNTAGGEIVDVKAAAVHVRTKFELILKNACEELSVPVPFKTEPKDLKLNTLWGCLCSHKMTLQHPPTFGTDKHGRGYMIPGKRECRSVVPKTLVENISHALSWVLNPLSHSESVERYRGEILDAIFALDDLERAVSEAKKRRAPDISFAQNSLILVRTNLLRVLSAIPAKLQRLLLLKPLTGAP